MNRKVLNQQQDAKFRECVNEDSKVWGGIVKMRKFFVNGSMD